MHHRVDVSTRMAVTEERLMEHERRLNSHDELLRKGVFGFISTMVATVITLVTVIFDLLKGH